MLKQKEISSNWDFKFIPEEQNERASSSDKTTALKPLTGEISNIYQFDTIQYSAGKP